MEVDRYVLPDSTHCYGSNLDGCTGMLEGPKWYVYSMQSAAVGLEAVSHCKTTQELIAFDNCMGYPTLCPDAGGCSQGILGYMIRNTTIPQPSPPCSSLPPTPPSPCGSVPLYQFAHAGDRLYVPPGTDYKNLVASGWCLEGVLGFVWLTPN
jgi:hypothetical protein